jgi:hypothetical protein
VLSTIATARTTGVLAADPKGGFAHALVAGFERSFLVGAVITAAAAVLALTTIPRNVGRSESTAPDAEVSRPSEESWESGIAAVAE